MPGHLHHVRLMHHSHKDRVAWGWMCGHLACHRWLQVLVSRPPPWPKPEDEPFTNLYVKCFPSHFKEYLGPFCSGWVETWKRVKTLNGSSNFNSIFLKPFETLIFTKGRLVFFWNVSFRSLVLRFLTPGRVFGERQDLCELFDGFGPIQAAKVQRCGGGMSCRKADGREKKWWCHFEALIIF